ncbi:MAG TPA: PAS domain S-box protein [Anaerolineales bacterium]
MNQDPFSQKFDKFGELLEKIHNETKSAQVAGAKNNDALPPGGLPHGAFVWPEGRVEVNLDEVFAEIQNALHELQVAEEGLRQQNDELLLARTALDAERQRYQDLFDFAPDGYLVTDTAGNIREANRAAAALLHSPPEALIGKSMVLFVAEKHRRAFRNQLSQLARWELQPDQLQRLRGWEVHLQPPNAPAFTAALTVAAIANYPAGEATPQVGVFSSGNGQTNVLRWLIRDITARKEAELALQRQTAQVQLLKEVASASNAAATAEEALQFAVDQVCAYTGWPVGHVYLRSGADAPEIVSTGIWHLDEPEMFETFRQVTEQTHFSPGKGLSGRVFASGKPQWVVDVTREPGFARESRPEDRLVRAGLFFPILVGREVAGVMEFFSKQPVEPDENLLEMMSNVGMQLGRVMERKQAEENIRREKEFTERVINSSYNGILAYDRDYHITVWNPRMEQISGLSRVEMLGQPVFEKLPFLVEIGEDHYYRLALEGQNSISRDRPFHIPETGRQGYFESYTSPIRDSDGQIRGGLSILRDVTESRSAEEKLRERDEMLRSAIQVTPLTFFVIDREGIIRLSIGRSGSPTDASFAGNGQPLEGHSIYEAYQHSPQIIAGYQRALRGETFTDLIASEAQVLETRYAPLFDSDGEIRAVVGVSSDITERRRVEEALLKSEARFRTIFEKANLGIGLVDLEGKIAESNPALQEILGYSREELHQMNLASLSYPADLIASQAAFRDLAEGLSDHYGVDKRYLHKDGRVVWAREMMSLFRDPVGQPLYVIGMIENISAQKQMEVELAEVERRLSDRAEIERLHLAQDLHDGPIQDLHGASYQIASLLDAISDPSRRTRLEEVQASLQQVIHALRATCGELRPPTLAPFGLEKAIRSHATRIHEDHPEVQLELSLMSDGQQLSERVRLALFRIYQHILINSIRHAQAKRITVRFLFDAEQIELSIADDGHGFAVPRRTLELVREGHFGLVGAIERAEAIGGRLLIESAPGEGTLVRVLVPREEEAQAAPHERLLRINSEVWDH